MNNVKIILNEEKQIWNELKKKKFIPKISS